jgi:ketosteroid isomerase-like protein
MTADPDASIDVARRWAEALNQRDVETLLSLSTEDVDCDPLQISVSGRYNGADGVRRWMREVTTHDPGHWVAIESVRALGEDRVAVFGRLQMSGRSVSPYTMVTIVRDGRIAAMRSYLSDETTLTELGLLS